MGNSSSNDKQASPSGETGSVSASSPVAVHAEPDNEVKPITSDYVKPPYGWVPPDPKWDRTSPPKIEPALRPSAVTIPEGATKLPLSELVSKIRGVILGNALGDAVGLSTEFMRKTQVQSLYGDMSDFTFSMIRKDQHRGKFVTGDWTDDTDQLLCILDSLLYNGGEIDERDIAYRIAYWSYNGYPELKDVMGLGLGQTVSEVRDTHAGCLYSFWLCCSSAFQTVLSFNFVL